MIDGILLLDKPAGPTSHDVVAAVRRLAGQRRVGHAGTLDPAATGLLVVLLGRYTRLSDAFSGTAKRYRAQVELGRATDTGDTEGRVTAERAVGLLEPERLREAVAALIGTRAHVPPAYSAVKVGGRTLHRVARAGGEVPEPPSRTIEVLEAQLVGFEGAGIGNGVAASAPTATLTLDLSVSKGTYVRVLAEELGESLGAPAHLSALRRTAAGPFTVDEAVALDRLEADGAQGLAPHLVDPEEHRLPVARARIAPDAAEALAYGRPIAPSRLEWLDEPADEALILREGAIVAWYGRARETTGDELMRPRAVLGGPDVRKAS